MLDKISIFLNYWGFICDWRCGLSWRMFHVHLRRRFILMHLDGCPEGINEIHQFCFDDLSIGLSEVLKSPTIIVLLSISPLMSFVVDFVDLCSSLVFLDYISPINICCKPGFIVLSSLNFCLSEKLFISPSILNEILARYSNLGCLSVL